MRIRVAVALALFALTPGLVSAQQTAGVIAGTVHDATGGVLPGVTVEVASPALIERVRSVVSGDDGQYRLVELRPGEYSVTFTLAGFGKFVRESVQITSGFTATVNAELKVGDLAETITVTGGSPVVDLQNVTQQQVMSRTTLDAIPTGRSFGAIGRLIPGMSVTGNDGGHDVGGAAGRDTNKLIIHGGLTADFKLLLDGMPQSTWIAGAGDNVGVPPADNIAEEVNLQFSALPAETETGGVLMNLIPRTGGNTFQTSVFSNLTTRSMQSDNLTEDLIAQGMKSAGYIDYVLDVNPSVGGPIQKDKLWFFVTYRDFRPMTYSNMFYDTNKTDWVYTPDESRAPANIGKPQKSFNSRVTWQATPRNRFSSGLEFSHIDEYNFLVGGRAGSFNSPEAVPTQYIRGKPIVGLSWTAPVSNKLLLEIGGQVYKGKWWTNPQYDISVAPGALETNTGINFRAAPTLNSTGYGTIPYWHNFLRGAVSYTTGSHAVKVGATLWHGGINNIGDSQGLTGGVGYTVRLLNGVPNGVTYRTDPNSVDTHFIKGAVFAQDQWTMRRLTINGGIRFDTIDSGYPAQHEEPTNYFPARDFPAGSVLRWRDVSPRLGVWYDLLGNGKTAVKFAFSRYVVGEAMGLTNTANPASASGGSIQRTWNDRLVCPTCISNDFIPQGDPTNPVANGEIGVSPNSNWGFPISTTRYDPAWSQGGWGVRGYNWERSASVQQELFSNVSLSFGYFYRTFGNFSITDNVAVAPTDFDSFCITAPSDARLPDGGGNQICGLYDVKPASASKLDNLVTSASNYGDIKQNYKGIDLSVNVRLPKVLLQGGLNSGRELYDYCGIVGALPERLISGSTKTPADQCHQEQPMLTQVKLIGSYQLPWALSVSSAYQNNFNSTAVVANILPGQPLMGLAAGYVASNAQILPSLGRNLSSGANGTATVNVVTPGSMWGKRLQQLDVRMARTFRPKGRTSIKAMFDLYNLLNVSTVTTYNTAYGTNGSAWLLPLAIVPGRIAKVGVQLDF